MQCWAGCSSVVLDALGSAAGCTAGAWVAVEIPPARIRLEVFPHPFPDVSPFF